MLSSFLSVFSIEMWMIIFAPVIFIACWFMRKSLWGDLTTEEYKRFGMLSLTFLFIIGTYWLLRPLKDGVFTKVVGVKYIPYAKWISFCVIPFLIIIYSKLVDMFKRHQLFYIICSFYAILYGSIAFFLMHPTIGLANTETSPDRIIGWAFYLAVESFGSLVVPLFWSFVNSTSDQHTAKRGYGLIIAGAQFGSIAGPLLAIQAPKIGTANLVAITVLGVLIVPVMIRIFTTMYPIAAVDNSTSKTGSGFAEGLKLLFSRPYLMGILGVATLYEIIGTITDYQMKYAAASAYATADEVTRFLGFFGSSANYLALIFALIGTSYFIRRYGLTFCLVMFPVAVGSVILYVWAFPSLWTLFGAMVAIKGLSYALNNPCKEIMYIPTSKDVKFKAKGWIDGFGGRSSKAVGAGICGFLPNMAQLMFFGSLISLGIIGIWIVVALYVGRTNKHLNDTGEIIS